MADGGLVLSSAWQNLVWPHRELPSHYREVDLAWSILSVGVKMGRSLANNTIIRPIP